MLLYLLGILFSPDAGDGGGSDGAADDGSEDNINSPKAGDVDGKKEEPVSKKDDGDRKEADEDAKDKVQMARDVFNARLRKAKASGQRDLLKALGFEDVSDPKKLGEAQKALQDLVSFAREQRKAKMSAEERFQEEVETYRKAADDAKQKLHEVQLQIRKREVQDALIHMAKSEGAQSPEDVYAWAVAFADSDVQKLMDSDGDEWELDGDSVKALVKRCKKERPDKFKPQHPGVPSNRGARPPAVGAKADEKAKESLRSYARRSF